MKAGNVSSEHVLLLDAGTHVLPSSISTQKERKNITIHHQGLDVETTIITSCRKVLWELVQKITPTNVTMRRLQVAVDDVQRVAFLMCHFEGKIMVQKFCEKDGKVTGNTRLLYDGGTDVYCKYNFGQ
jgi:hypothetical protein